VSIIAALEAEVAKCLEKELQSGEALLAIDDCTSLDMTRGFPYLI